MSAKPKRAAAAIKKLVHDFRSGRADLWSAKWRWVIRSRMQGRARHCRQASCGCA